MLTICIAAVVVMVNQIVLQRGSTFGANTMLMLSDVDGTISKTSGSKLMRMKLKKLSLKQDDTLNCAEAPNSLRH